MITESATHVLNWPFLGPLLVILAALCLLICADIAARLVGDKRQGIGLFGSMLFAAAGALISGIWGFVQWAALDANPSLRSAPQSFPLAKVFSAQGFPAQLQGGSLAPVWSGSALVVDAFSVTVGILVSLVLLFVTLMLYRYMQERSYYRFEVFPLVLLSASGMMLLGMSRDLLITFIAIELLSLPLYVLCGMLDDSRASRESSLKYFLTGAFASGFLIYGAALIYGQVGHLNYQAMNHYLTSTGSYGPGWLIIVGVALVGAGLAFKMALVPFHAWVPDVYQGAPTPVTAFMATGVKVAIFAGGVRFFSEALDFMQGQYWQDPLIVFAIFSMVVGNLFALHQMSAKRLLAYSAIAHTGYLTIGMATGSHNAGQSALIYLAGYALATIGAFTVITYLSPKGQDDIYLDELHELSSKSPLAAAMLTVFLLSMGGFPLTAGFIGKLAVFTEAWRGGLWPLVIFAVLNSVVSFYYYLRFILAMYMQPRAPGERELVVPRLPMPYAIAGIATLVLTLLLGVMPGLLYRLTGICIVGL